MMKLLYLVFELGTFQVYTIQDATYLGHVPGWTPEMATDNYWWRDPASPQGYGPFKHVTACVEHYKWVINTCRGKSDQKLLTAPTNSVLRVDFKSKKLVISDV